MHTSTNFSPINITLDKYNEFDTLCNVLESSIDDYEKESNERNFLIALVNDLSEVYNFNEDNQDDYGHKEYSITESSDSQVESLLSIVNNIEKRLTEVEEDLYAVHTNTNSNDKPARQSRAEWHKMTIAWAKGADIEYYDFNEPGWYDLPNGQEEWYGYDEDVAYRIK